MNNNKNNIWLHGRHVLESIVSNKEREVYKILCTSQNHNEVKDYVTKIKRPNLLKLMQVVDKNEISKCFNSVNHQSIAICCSKKNILTIDNLLHKMQSRQEMNNILVLDQLTDPQNIGTIIRSATAFGVRNIVVPNNSFPPENPSMVKASSGNFEKVRIYSTNNISNVLVKIKKHGYWCIGLAGESSETIEKIKKFEKVAIVIGSEGKGIRPLVKKNCDALLRIPMLEDVESLNVSSATSIALYEIYQAQNK